MTKMLRNCVILTSVVLSAQSFAGDPTFTAAFSPSTVASGVPSKLTFTIDNTANDTALGSVAFSATLPTGVTISASPDAATDCNSAQISAAAGDGSFSLSDARIGTGTSCTFSFNVFSSTVGTHSLTTGALTSSAGTHTTANADLTVSSTLPSFSMSASPSTVAPGGVTTLTYTIDNSLVGSNTTFIDFSHIFTNGFDFAESPEFTHDCPLRTISTFVLGSFAISTSSISVTANDIELNAGASCTATVNIRVPDEVGAYHLETGSLSSSAGTTGMASTLITVGNEITNGSVMAMSFSGQASPGESVTLDFELVNANRDEEITSLNFTADLNAALSGLVATSLPSTGFCGAGSTISGSSNLAVSNVSLASEASCEFSVTVLVPSNAAAGDYSLTSSTVNLIRGSVTTSTAATTMLIVRKSPLVTMQFLSSSAVPEEEVTMRLMVTNTDTANSATAITFAVLTTDGLAGFVGTTFPSANFCGTGSTVSASTESSGTVTGFTITGANLTAGANCTFDVVLTVPSAAQAGTYDFATSNGSATVGSSNLGIGVATDSLSIIAAPSLSFSISESDAVPGGTISLNFSLKYNANASADATGVGFTVDLDAALAGLAATSLPSTGFCGSGSTASGSTLLTFAGVTLSPGEDCEFSVSALVPSNAAAGTTTVNTSSVSGSVGSTGVTSAATSDSFITTGLVLTHEYLTQSILPGSDTTIRYTITNDANADAATAIQFSHDLSSIISGLMVSGSLPGTPCNGSSSISGTTNLAFSAGELSSGSSCSFDVTVSVPANADGTYTSVTSSASATVNSVNTSFSASSAFLNVQPLTVLLSTSEASPTSLSAIPLSISFSRDVTGFIAGDLEVSNGSIINFSGSGSEYTASIIPDNSGTVTVDLPANAVDDAIDNTVKNPAATQLSIEYDAAPATLTPTVSIASPSANITNSGPISYTVTYSNVEQVSLTTTSLTLNSTGTATGTLGVTGGETSTPAVSISNISGEGTLGITVLGGASRNGAKTDSGAGPSPTFSVDNTRPTVTIVDFVANPYNSSFPVTITFSEDVSGFTIDDLSFSNAQLSNFSATSANVYTVTVTPEVDGQVTGNLAANSATDSAGNGNTAAPGFGMIYDSTAPTVSISGASASNAAFTATFTFSEDVTGFTVADIAVTNAGVSNFAATSASVYTATITPASEGSVTVNVAGNVAQDTAGNNNAAASQFTSSYDVSGPGVSISSDSAIFQTTQLVTFTFTEDVTGFAVTDISVSNGSAGSFSSISASVYTAIITAASDGSVSVDVPSAIATDVAGNSNSAATQLVLNSDSSAPTLSDTTPADNAVGTIFTSDLILTFSENILLNTVSNGSLQLIELSALGDALATLTFNVSAGNFSGPGSVTINNSVLTIDLNADLKIGTRYALQIASDLLQDAAGNYYSGIANNTDLNFVTRPGVKLTANQLSLTEEVAEQSTVTLALFDAQNQPFTTPEDVTIALSFNGSTATADTDFSISGLASSSLTISANSSNNTFTITAKEDAVDDDNESVEIAVDAITTNNAAEIQEQTLSIAIVENAAPTMTGLPISITLSEDVKGHADFSSSVISDEENDVLSLTLTLDTGRVVSPKGSVNNVNVTPLGPTSIRFSGLPADLTNYLDSPNAIAIVPPKNHVSAMTLSVLLGDGTEQANTENITVTITPVNDSPRLVSGTISEFDMAGGSIDSTLVFTETDNNRTLTATLDAGNWVNADLDTLGGTTDGGLYSDAESTTSSVTVSFDQKVNLESLVYFFNVGSVPDSITFTPTGHRGEPISLTASDFTVDDVGTSVELRGWLGITSFTITSDNGAFAPGLDTVVYSLPPANFSFQEDQPGNLDFSSLSLSDDDSSQVTLKFSADTGVLGLTAAIDRAPVNDSTASRSSTINSSLDVVTTDTEISITGSVTEINSILSDDTLIEYTPDTDQSGSGTATITVTVDDNDGSGEVEVQSISVDISEINDAPILSNLDGDSASFIQGGGAVSIDVNQNAIASDVDNDNLAGGYLSVAITSGGASTEDLLSVDNSVTLASFNSGANVTVDNITIGTLGNAVSEGNDFVVNLNSEATLSRVSGLLNALTFENTDASSPTEGDRTISVTLSDGEDVSEAASVNISFVTLDENTTVNAIGYTTSGFSPDIDTSAEAFNFLVFSVVEEGTDGIDTTITQIDFSLGGTLDPGLLNFELEHKYFDSDIQDFVVGGTYQGTVSGKTLTFNDQISLLNGNDNQFLNLKVYFIANTGMVDNQTLTVSFVPVNDIQTLSTGSAISTSTTESNNLNPLSVEITASSLVYSTEPAGSISGLALSTQPIVEAQDDYGNVDMDFVNSVTLNAFGAGSLTGNNVTASDGVARFTEVTYNASGDNESFVLVANTSATSVSQATSNTMVSDVVATRVVFFREPSPTVINAGAVTAFTTVPIVNAVNAQRLIDSDYNKEVTISEVNGLGSAQISTISDLDLSSSTATLNFNAGVVSFTGLSVSYSVTGAGNETFNLAASSGTLNSATSTQITANDLPIIEGVPTELIVVEDEASPLDLSAMAFVDSDGNELTVTLTVGTGTLTVLVGDGTTSGVGITGSDTSSITLQGNATDIMLLLSDTSVISYLSELNDDTDATLTILANDGQVDSAASAISLSITGVNDAPTISGENDTLINQGTAYELRLTASDIEGDTLSFSIVNQPGWAEFDTATGQLSGTPENGDVGSYTDIVVTVSDGSLTASTNSFSITVSNINDVPVISGTPETTVNEDTAYSFTPTALDVDGDPLTFSVTNLPLWAVFNESTGTLSGVPGNDDVGTYSNIVVSVTDGTETISLDSFSITVVAVNDAPEISGVPATLVVQSSMYTFTPNVVDVDNDTFIFSVVNLPVWGEFDTTTGTLSGVPEATDVGEYSDIIIIVSDGELTASLTPFSITVQSHNTAPIAQNVNATVDEDSAVAVTLLGSDEDNDALTYRVVETSLYGSVEINGSVAVYTPNADVSGIQDQFSYVVNDGITDSATAVVTITIAAVNDAPVISGSPGTQIKVAKNYSFMPEASDIDNGNLTFSIKNAPGWAQFNNDTGHLSGTPQSGDVGTYGNIQISVSDGELSAQLASFSLVVIVNSPPEISGTPSVVAEAGATYSFMPQVSDEDSDTLIFKIQNQPVWAQFDTFTGELSGIPAVAQEGSYTGIVISVTDGINTVSLPTFSIRVCEVCNNIAPVISGSPATSIVAGSLYEFVPLASDENNDELEFTVANLPSWASFSPTSGALTGEPQESDVGLFTGIAITVSDGLDSVTLRPFSINVTSANAAPTIAGIPATSVFKGESYNFNPVAADADNDTLSFRISNKPGWASFNPQTGRLKGTPQADNIGVYSNIEIRVTDNINEAVKLPVFSIEVLDRNTAPVISGTPRTKITQGKVYSFQPTSNDADGDTLAFTVQNLPGWLEFDLQTGALTGTPTENDIAQYDGITIQVSDGKEQVSLAAFSISVVSDNIAPLATDMEIMVSEDKSVSIVASVDDENQDELSLALVSEPANGLLAVTDSGWLYTPNANFNGNDSFVYRASDGELESLDATVSISISPVNDKPIANNDVMVINQVESGVYFLDVLANDEDVDIGTNADSLIVQRASTNFGSVEIVSNQLQLTTGASFIGTVDLTYSIRDQDGKNSTGKVKVTISGEDGINAPTILVPEDLVVNATGLLTRVFPGTATAVDAEGNQLPVSLVDDNLNFAPGLHYLYWQAEDRFGTSSTEVQEVSVLPIVSVIAPEAVAEGTDANIRFILNGDAPSYPFIVNYSVSGNAEGGGIDHSGASDSVVINNSQEQVVTIQVFADSQLEGDETIIVSLDEGQNTGANNSATIIITEQNIAPAISLSLEQAGNKTSVVAQNEGDAIVIATVDDPNLGDSLTYDWSSDDLINSSNQDSVFQFSPASVNMGVYLVSLYVYDDGEPVLDATDTLSIEVVTSLTGLSDTEDTDGDLIPDAQEGYTDSDGDGIADYLDAIDDCNVIAAQADNQSEFLVESEPGACMRLGGIAAQNESNGLQVIFDESGARRYRINLEGEKVALLANGLPEDKDHENIGGVFDFVIYDLVQVGKSVRIVLPQSEALPENAVYRKYDAKIQRWRSFIIDDNNTIYSAPGEPGICPPPGAFSWKTGLTAGHWCVQLRIEDGGPNDEDLSVNGSVADTGGVAVFVSDNTKPVALNDALQLNWNSSSDVDVLANDSDPDGDELFVRSASAKLGTVEILPDSKLNYVAVNGYSGNDSISYIIGDGNGGRASAKVTINILGNRAPAASDDLAEVSSLSTVEIDVLANDSDIDGDLLSISVANAEFGSVIITANNSLIYTPALDFNGLDTIEYFVIDTSGAMDSAIVNVFVDGNQAPVAVNDTISTEEDIAVTINILSNDSDADGDEITVTDAMVSTGTVIINSDNTLTYTPATGFVGNVTIQYSISDGLLSATGAVNVRVTAKPVEVIEVNAKSGGALSLLVLFGLFLSMTFKLRRRQHQQYD